VYQHRLPGGVRVGAIYEASFRVGAAVNRARAAWRGSSAASPDAAALMHAPADE
jgi:hypothetical protein